MTPERVNWEIHAGDGPPCLMIHGALGSRSYWNENLRALSTLATPVSIELWGHGSSPSPADSAAYEPAGYIDQFERIRCELGAERVFVIGQSMGAALMLHYALAHPDRVIALVLTNSSSAFSEPDKWRRRHERTVVDRAREIRENGVESLRDSWINPSRSRRIPERTRTVLDIEFGGHQTEGVARSFEVTNQSLPLGDRLREVTAPTLLTVGVEEERFLPLVERARLIPGLTLAEIDASHAVNAQNPGQWNDAVVEFLQLHRPDPTVRPVRLT